MLNRTYDPTQPYRFVKYGRMSDRKQNKRSPEQQFNTIEETIHRCGYSWQCARIYRDDGISGRKIRNRPGFQCMLRDIEAGLITVDLIVVDTYERLGRAEEIANICHKLSTDHGILVVAADNNFSDPTGVVGKAVRMIEQVRSTENTRTSSHNVKRGKKDTARLRRWPGGPAPFGFRLKPVVDDSTSPATIYHLLEVEPREAAAQRLVFRKAAETGHGALRLTQWWNASHEIPEEFKPISNTTMLYRLRSRIYVGTLVWGANCTDIINDTRVVERNPEGPEIVPDFCPPLVSVELFNEVQRLQEIRSKQIQDSRAKNASDSPKKLIKPQARGLVLKYLLTGLVRCGCCNASMRPVPSKSKSKGGKQYSYAYYACPRYMEGACANGKFVREDHLREAVTSRVRSRLFPTVGDGLQVPTWFSGFVSLIQTELERYQAEDPDRAEARDQEMRAIERNLNGWSISLGDPALPSSVRSDIVAKYEQAKSRKHQLEQFRQTEQALRNRVSDMLNPQAVITQLRRLNDILGSFNPTLGNLELSKHIEKILVHSDRRIEMRGTLLGLFDGATELLSGTGVSASEASSVTEPGGQCQVVPRRRGRLRIPNLSSEALAASDVVDTDLDPERFVGVPEPFLWSETFVLDRTPSWGEIHAAEVARERLAGKTHEQLAKDFRVSVPTIRDALEIASENNESLKQQPRKMPRRRWHEDHAQEVAKLKAEGMSVIEIAEKFRKSDTTVRDALDHAKNMSSKDSIPMPEDEGHRSESSTTLEDDD